MIIIYILIGLCIFIAGAIHGQAIDREERRNEKYRIRARDVQNPKDNELK